MKPKIAIFSLTSCEGCSLAILELENELLDILGAVDIVNFREGMTERSWDIDIGFVDGAVSTPTDVQELQHFRKSCKVLVGIGSCACLGGVSTMKNYQDESDYRKCVYGDGAKYFPTMPTQPLSAVVKIDAELPGCPMIKEEFLDFVKCALAGKQFRLPETAVCVECKKQGNLCLYEKEIICLGPVTRAGCSAICPTFGAKCEGCRGLASTDALKAAGVNLREQYNVSLDDVLADFRLYGAYQKADLP
jgi:sulfhydrogenase subunit delta